MRPDNRFVEVQPVGTAGPLLLHVDAVLSVAPLPSGGCLICGVPGSAAERLFVSDEYDDLRPRLERVRGAWLRPRAPRK